MAMNRISVVAVFTLLSLVFISFSGYILENDRYTVPDTNQLNLLVYGIGGEEKALLAEDFVNASKEQHKYDNWNRFHNRQISHDSLTPVEVRENERKISNSSDMSSSRLIPGTVLQNISMKGQEQNPVKVRQNLDGSHPRPRKEQTNATGAKQGAIHVERANWRNLPDELYRLAPSIFDTVPKEFLPEFKNPCWYASDEKLRCLPYFYIPGFPKCGTTDLWFKINKHPKIAKTRQKETHYWAGYKLGSQLPAFYRYLSNGISLNDRLLSGETDAIYGDASPTTIYMHWRFSEKYQNVTKDMYTKIDIIKELTPKAKMIIMVREPVERFYSGYLFVPVNGGHSARDFHNKTLKSIAEFEECLQRDTELMKCLCVSGPEIFRSKRLTTSIYVPFIKAWVNGFGFDQIMFIRIEDWKVNCTSILPKVYEFLGLDSLTGDVIQDICTAKPKNVNTEHKSVGEMLPETKQILDEFFAPYNKDLAEYLNISVYHARS